MACHPERRSELRSRGGQVEDLLLPAARGMPSSANTFWLAATVMLTTAAWSDCFLLPKRGKHVGEIKCITGTVIRVKQGSREFTFWTFATTTGSGPFTS